VQACLCPGNSSDQSQELGGGTWDFYLRYYGQYVVEEMENFTCTISPYLANVTCSVPEAEGGLTNITSTQPTVTPNSSIFGPMLALLPQAFHTGQNMQGNMVAVDLLTLATEFTANDLFTSQFVSDPGFGHLYRDVLETYLRGWVEYIGTSIRQQYQMTIASAVSATDFSHLQPDVRIITGQVSVPIYGWHYTSFSVVFLTPVVLVTFATLALLLWALVHPWIAELPTFEPKDPLSLILVGAYCDDELKVALKKTRKGEGDFVGNHELRKVEVVLRDGELKWASKQ